MRKPVLLCAFIAMFILSNAQKIKNETLQYGLTHIPEKIIYDQIKTYGVDVNVVPSNGFNLDYNFATNSAGKFQAYSKVPYENADMQIMVKYGPYTALEEKTFSRAVSEEVNKVKTSVTYYKRKLTFKFPIIYTVTNKKNGVKLYYNEHGDANQRSIETSEYKTEQEAVTTLNQGKALNLQADINRLIELFCSSSNAAARDLYDFYATGSYMPIYTFKKWEKDDEYNNHIKNVIKTFAVMTADENANSYNNKLNDDLTYFKSFEGKFKPNDKDEDILYFGNYYNLAIIYHALDDYEKASYYLQMLDSSEKEKSARAGLKTLIDRSKRRTAKHYITGQHLNYNPVNDYRLGDKKFTSDAMSSTEAMSQSVVGGAVEAVDEAITSDGKILKGKIFFDKENSQLKLIPTDKADAIVLLTPFNSSSFKIEDRVYAVAKASIDGELQKYFFRIEYKSEKIQLLQLLKADLTVYPDYIGLLRPKEDLVNILLGLNVKKNMGKYFSDCPAVSEKAKEGDFGGSIYGNGSKDRTGKFIEMCKEYTDCK